MGTNIKSFSNRQCGGQMSPLAFGLIFFLIFGGIGLFILKISYSAEIKAQHLIDICTEETKGELFL